MARPPYDQLLAEVEASGYSSVARKYGVSDKAVRKWLRAYEREADERSSETGEEHPPPPP